MTRTHVVQIESLECHITTHNFVFHTRFSQRLEHVLGGARATKLSVGLCQREANPSATPPSKAVPRLRTMRIEKKGDFTIYYRLKIHL